MAAGRAGDSTEKNIGFAAFSISTGVDYIILFNYAVAVLVLEIDKIIIANFDLNSII